MLPDAYHAIVTVKRDEWHSVVTELWPDIGLSSLTCVL